VLLSEQWLRRSPPDWAQRGPEAGRQ